ncbi:hypothetical protein N431DRAFT_112654 [Stipitochalara longipes BDJ]|nr:hypothetical protein N431DRAFT_112654 [Stipitochalara longipes BDJ]
MRRLPGLPGLRVPSHTAEERIDANYGCEQQYQVDRRPIPLLLFSFQCILASHDTLFGDFGLVFTKSFSRGLVHICVAASTPRANSSHGVHGCRQSPPIFYRVPLRLLIMNNSCLGLIASPFPEATQDANREQAPPNRLALLGHKIIGSQSPEFQ